MMQFIAHVLQMFQHRLDDCTLYDGNGWSVSAANNLKSNQNIFKYISSEFLKVFLIPFFDISSQVQVLDDNVPVGVGEDAELHTCGCDNCQVKKILDQCFILFFTCIFV